MILSKPQAEAVYSAMCALNTAGVSRFSAIIPGKDSDGRSTSTEVSRVWGGGIVAEITGYNLDRRECHADQSAFATAYGLGHGGDKNAAALEQIARLGREGTRDGQIIRDAMTEIAEKATAYGLSSDEPQSDVAAAAGGLTQVAIER